MDDRNTCSDVQSSSWCGQLKGLCDCTCACTSNCVATTPSTAGNLEYAIGSLKSCLEH